VRAKEIVMKNKAKFGAFLLRRYKGVAVYLFGIGILFGVVAHGFIFSALVA
jgi:hypothetical protein